LSLVLAAIVIAGIAGGCGGPATVVPATATLSPPAADGGYGWYRTGPVMTLAGDGAAGAAYGLQYSMDGGQTWLAYSAPVTLPEGYPTVSYRTSDIWGMPTSANSFYYQSDRTGPVVTWTGNHGWYWRFDFVSIDCYPSEVLSGLARNGCYPILGEAWTFGMGAHTFSATADDWAGNTGQGSVSFTVMDPLIFIPLDPVIVSQVRP
jgi:hypothetical protein